MPETEAPPLPNPVIPEGASMEQLFNLTTGQEPTVPGQPTPQVQPAPAKAPEPQPEAKTVPDDIPEQFLGVEKKEAPTDDFEKLVSEEPQGQLKHEHYKRVQASAKKKVDAVTAELASARAELEAAKARGVPEEIQAELKNVRDALAEREAVLERIAVQESPKFKERYTQRETAIAERLKRTATELGLDGEAVQRALGSTLKYRAELLDNIDLSPSARSAIDSLMTQYDLLQDDKGQFLAQSKEAHAKWQQEQTEAMTRQEKETLEREEKTFASVADEMSKTYAPYQEVEGNEAWNAQARALREEAKKYFNGQVPLDELARAVMKGVGAPVQDKIIARLNKANSDLRAELASLKTAQPGSNGGLPSPDGKVDLSQMTPDQRAAYHWQQAMNQQ